MRKLTTFQFISLNGFYKGVKEDISWHRHGSEENEYSADSLQPGNILLFGRVTYEMMAGWWPSPIAMEQDPIVAKGMNDAEKIVFSRTLEKTTWTNSRLVKENIVEEIKRLKQLPGKDMTLLGSGSILTQFAAHRLIDSYQVMIDPVAIGNGTSLFGNLEQPLDLELTSAKTFKSGTVLLEYRPKN